MIRLAQPQDAAAVARVHVRSWQQAYRELMPADYLNSLDATLERRTEYWSAAITQGQPQVFVALAAEQVVGWIAVDQSRDPDAKPGSSGEIQALYVLAEHWDKGLGRALWLKSREHLLDRAFESVTLWVLAQNQRAIRFYRNAGFSPDNASLRTIARPVWTLEEVRYRANF